MPRLFIAIDLPEVHKALLADLQDPTLSVRWTPPAQFHLTLRFIGDVDADTRVAVEKALDAIHSTPFTIEGQGLGVFPSLRKPRVIFAGISPAQALLDLYEGIRHALGKIGIAPDSKPFRPHITLARVKQAIASEIRSYLQSHESLMLPPVAVSQFYLYESILKPDGAHHNQLCTFALSTTA